MDSAQQSMSDQLASFQERLLQSISAPPAAPDPAMKALEQQLSPLMTVVHDMAGTARASPEPLYSTPRRRKKTKSIGKFSSPAKMTIRRRLRHLGMTLIAQKTTHLNHPMLTLRPTWRVDTRKNPLLAGDQSHECPDRALRSARGHILSLSLSETTDRPKRTTYLCLPSSIHTFNTTRSVPPSASDRPSPDEILW